MNLLNNKWITINHFNIEKKYQDNLLFLKNRSNKKKIVLYPKGFKNQKGFSIFFELKNVNSIKDKSKLKIFNRKGKVLGEVSHNQNKTFKTNCGLVFVGIEVPGNTSINIKSVDFNIIKVGSENLKKLENSTQKKLILVNENIINNRSFELKINKCSPEYRGLILSYSDGISVKKNEIEFTYVNKSEVRSFILRGNYEEIHVHGFTEENINIVSGLNIYACNMKIFVYKMDLLNDSKKFLESNYFQPRDVNAKRKNFKEENFIFVKNMLQTSNIILKFESLLMKDNFVNTFKLQELETSNFLNYEIEEMDYGNITKVNDKKPSNINKEKIIYVTGDFDNKSINGLDISIEVVRRLINEKLFKDLQVKVIGEGTYHYSLLRPLMDFPNVEIIKTKDFENHLLSGTNLPGILLYSNRYCEDEELIIKALRKGFDVVCDCESLQLGSNFDNLLYNTSNKELAAKTDLVKNLLLGDCEKWESEKNFPKVNFRKSPIEEILNRIENSNDTPILSIVIPSYNVEMYLERTVNSILYADKSERIEIIIVNDGSKDKTEKIGAELSNTYKNITFISKENGGHGSTINKGLEVAKGKYFRILDADDYLDTIELNHFMKRLEKEDCDLILNNYVADFTDSITKDKMDIYYMLQENKEYQLKDISFKGYYFNDFGPVLSTSTIKTELLRNVNMEIPEKCFYADMVYNYFVYISARTVKKYDLYLYIYMLGSATQSVSPESFYKNIKDHEKVIFTIIELMIKNKSLEYAQKAYIEDLILATIIRTNYLYCFKNKKLFIEFEDKLKKYEEVYTHPSIMTEEVIIMRDKIYGK